jgi:hypothetical protein
LSFYSRPEKKEEKEEEEKEISGRSRVINYSFKLLGTTDWFFVILPKDNSKSIVLVVPSLI